MTSTERENLFIHEIVMDALLQRTSSSSSTIAGLRKAVSVLIRPDVSQNQFTTALREGGFADGRELLPLAYFQSIGKPQGTVTFPAWAGNISSEHCYIFTGKEVSFDEIENKGFDQTITSTSGLSSYHTLARAEALSIYNGYMYSTAAGPIMINQQWHYDIYALILMRDLPSGDSETISFRCQR